MVMLRWLKVIRIAIIRKRSQNCSRTRVASLHAANTYLKRGRLIEIIHSPFLTTMIPMLPKAFLFLVTIGFVSAQDADLSDLKRSFNNEQVGELNPTRISEFALMFCSQIPSDLNLRFEPQAFLAVTYYSPANSSNVSVWPGQTLTLAGSSSFLYEMIFV